MMTKKEAHAAGKPWVVLSISWPKKGCPELPGCFGTSKSEGPTDPELALLIDLVLAGLTIEKAQAAVENARRKPGE